MLDQAYDRLFAAKPELVLDFPEWMTTPAELDRLAGLEGLAIVELAGRDSVAAALAAARQGGPRHLLPVLAYTGSEFGDFAVVEKALERLARGLPDGVELHPLLLMGSPRFWRALNGSLLQSLQRRYGFCPVCPGCHLYLHAVRLPLALRLGGAPIIAGERASHDGKVKINQLPLAQRAYARLAESFGVELMLPLAEMESGREVERILGVDWPGGGEQLDCVLSGNYREARGGVDVSLESLAAYFDGFALPLAQGVLREWLAGRAPDFNRLAEEAWEAGR